MKAPRLAGELSLVLAIALTAAPAGAQNGQAGCSVTRYCPHGEPVPEGGPVPEDQEEESRRNHGNDAAVVAVGAIAVVGVAVLANEVFGGDGMPSAKELDSEGPRLPREQPLGRFQAEGYAQAGWPVVVDFEATPGTETWLEVRIKGRKPQLIPIPEGVGRRVAVVHLAGDPGEPPRAARFSLNSALPREDGKPDYRPLRTYAIGAGPHAVGSTTVWIASFGPREARLPTDIGYTIESRRIFQKSVVEVLLLPRQGNKVTRIGAAAPAALMEGRHGGSWAGLRVSPKVAHGTFSLQARAWRLGNTNERDWTVAVAPNYVVVR
jgi:hypothetical protein